MPRQVYEILRCPTTNGGQLAAAIRNRGNLPVAFGRDCVIELTPRDIRENWKAATALKRDVAGAVAAELSARLYHCGDDEEDTAAHAGEAAACLFLSIHHQGLVLEETTKGCRVLWDNRRYSEQVERLS